MAITAETPSRVLELNDALCNLALASDAELELAARALEPYDVTRLALLLTVIDEANIERLERINAAMAAASSS